MKKFIALVCLLFLPLLYIVGQKSTFIDTNKKDTVTLNIISEGKKQAASIDNLQGQFVKVIENQTLVNQALTNGIVSCSDAVTAFTKEIEKRNKNDGKFITDSFGYSPDQVKNTIRKERWLNFSAILVAVLYFVWVRFDKQWQDKLPPGVWALKFLYYLVAGVLLYLASIELLTYIFNGDYYVIKELTHMYT
jgi:hypothetical protein